MTAIKKKETKWYPRKRLIVTHISGDLNRNDVEEWGKSLKKALNKIEDHSKFKILVNMYGFTAVNIEVHQRFRAVIPTTLANYGWKVGYVNLFEKESETITYKTTKGISCVGAAHSHHDKTKMDLYETKFGNENERFFTDPEQAKQWIENLEITN